jgi:hypothetical protein
MTRDDNKDKLSRLFEIQFLLMKEQRMIDTIEFQKIQIAELTAQLALEKSKNETERALIKAERAILEAERLKSQLQLADKEAILEAERLKSQLQLANKEAKTNLLAEKSKLHMRGLVELLEQEFSKDPTFIEVLNEKQSALDQQSNIYTDRKKVDRKTKWAIMLALQDYDDLKQKLLQEFKHDNEITTQINALLGNLNSLIHNPLKDILDPPCAGSFVINRLSVGDFKAKLLSIIAEHCNISYVIIP